jgi:hypothetical protein
MFTCLSKEGILKALDWLLAEMEKTKQYSRQTNKDRTPRKHRRNIITYINDLDTWDWGPNTHIRVDAPRNANTHVEGPTTRFTFQQLRSIVETDLEYTYASLGKTTFFQLEGCPIGGLLSSFYANLFCAWRECMFTDAINSIEGVSFHGIRQVDDMLGVLVVHPDTKENREKANALIDRLEREVYTGGLELETEMGESDGSTFYHEFAGCEIIGSHNGSFLKCKSFNKNWQSLLTTGKQKTRRFPHWRSYTHAQTKRGVIIGTLHRLATQTSALDFQNSLTEAVEQTMTELASIEYPSYVCLQALKSMTKKADDNTWLAVYDHIRSQIHCIWK